MLAKVVSVIGSSPRFPMCRVLASCALLLALAPALACGDKEIKITVVAILATDQDNKIDPELDCIAKAVRKKEPKLTGFKLYHICCKYIPVGGKGDFALVGDQRATVEVRHALDEDNRIGLKVKPPLAGEITYTTCCGKFFPIVTRYQTGDKQRLILAIKVQDCKK